MLERIKKHRSAKDESRERRGTRTIEDCWSDVRYGARILLKRPSFTLLAILTLAVGIGANTTVFSLVYPILIRPLPFSNPDQILMVWGTNPNGFGWHGKTGFSTPTFLDYQRQNQAFERMATFNAVDFTLTSVENPKTLRVGKVSAEFFDLLAVQPILGRTFVSEETSPGRDHVTVLSYHLWQQVFNADPKILDRTIVLDDIPYTVVGVLPQRFRFNIPEYFEARDLWIPDNLPLSESERGHKYLSVIARLKSGFTLAQADQDMSLITQRLVQQYPNQMNGFGVRLIPLHEQMVTESRLILLLLFASVFFVLMIACANVASLQLAHASSRYGEMAIRSALGANRFRLLRQVLTESLLLSLFGGVLGVLLAAWGIKLLTESNLINTSETVIRINSPVLLFSLGTSLITGILFGLAPALLPPQTRLSELLKSGGRTTGTDGGSRLRRLLMISEVAFSVVLIVGAGLLIRTVAGLLKVNPGFDTTNILTMSFELPTYAYADATKQSEFYAQVIERIKALPGVTAVGLTDELPPRMGRHANSFSIQGHPPINQSDQGLEVQDRTVSADYFRVMGIKLISGRIFLNTDDAGAMPVALINSAFARTFFPHENAIGQQLRFDSSKPWITIVGIVGDVRGFGLDKQPISEIYFPYQQYRLLPYRPLGHMNLVARTERDPSGYSAAALRIVRELDKNLPLPRTQPLESVIAASIGDRRSSMLLLSIFAMIALTLTAVGIYGVISYSVAQRTREMGIRMALGARSIDVLKLVIMKALSLVLIGIAIGLAGVFVLTRWMTTLLFAVSSTDSLTLVTTTLLLAGIALVASLIPALRATRVDPLIALKYE